MTFDEILEQVISLLKRQGRVSYPALKIRFNLEDDYLEALKAEILYVHPVVDDAGRGLIWTGESETAQAALDTFPSQIPQQPAAQEAQRAVYTDLGILDALKQLNARLEPGTVVISGATYRLIQGYFDCQNLGEQTLRGVSQPLVVYQVLQGSGVQSRLDVASTRGLTPLVGRESEVTLLLERWEQTKDGQGQVILLSGEAGIGKSRLV